MTSGDFELYIRRCVSIYIGLFRLSPNSESVICCLLIDLRIVLLMYGASLVQFCVVRYSPRHAFVVLVFLPFRLTFEAFCRSCVCFICSLKSPSIHESAPRQYHRGSGGYTTAEVIDGDILQGARGVSSEPASEGRARVRARGELAS